MSDPEKGYEDRNDRINLVNNVNARIQNPLHGIPQDKLLAQVEEFTREKDFDEYIETFKKGALLAQRPSEFETLPLLDESDREAIRREKTHKWSQPKDLYITVIMCSLAAVVQGWDQTGSNAANLSFPEKFGLSTADNDPDKERHDWIVGAINAAPYIACALLGCWLTDPLNNYLGRRGTIFVCGIFCTITVIGSAFSHKWPQLFVCRLFLGLGMGPKASTTPVFAAESTPASIRGGLVMSWQMWTAFGIFLGFCANLIFYCIVGDIAWRLQLLSAAMPAVPLVLGIYLCPESPRWYMKKGRYAEAFKSFKRLRNTELQAARDLYYVHRQLMEEYKVTKGITYLSRFIELFTIPRLRRATLASWIVMIAQQMCGINVMAFYSSTLFARAGYSPIQAMWGSFGFGLANWLFAFPAVSASSLTIDTFGRRNLLLFTFPNMAWTLLAAGFCFKFIPVESSARVPLIALFIAIFTVFYSPGEGPVPYTYSAEVFPLTHREMGMSWAVATCLGWASILAITLPRMLTVLTEVGVFGFYAGLNVLALTMIFFLVPETKQRTLEELDYVFAVPIRKHAAYQGGTFLPYWIKKWVFGQRDAVLEPLYHLEEVESIAVSEKGVGY
ncbi:hypothetical protein ARMSODRAFT_937544 [Armillaria solidipes]|uniref:Major facilitator superfamily (MFS) profile domain-containing protein n=1 Tax=Armillaria solidipes TaxID=1076256 RepID=A0A2H3BVZ0_9AGAR|nr:hypothetical protein ARMSODRAFT_937544 [Armillaria solidipes]